MKNAPRAAGGTGFRGGPCFFRDERMAIKLGMCGFTIGASSYYAQFPVVEIQQTFYDPPPQGTIARWRAQAPADFEFTMKAWQVITHAARSPTYRRMKRSFTDHQRAEAGDFKLNETTLYAWAETLAACNTLHATKILFQCPASFKPTDENVAAMREFFRAIERPESVGLVWEPRGAAWTDDLVRSLCTDLDLTHAVDPFVRPSVTPDLLYWRLHGNGSAYASYTDEELLKIRDWLPQDPSVDTYLLFNNIPRVKDVRRLRELAPHVFGAKLT
jgi:uncharacterized protein YecE (DUF72 family)